MLNGESADIMPFTETVEFDVVIESIVVVGEVEDEVGEAVVEPDVVPDTVVDAAVVDDVELDADEVVNDVDVVELDNVVVVEVLAVNCFSLTHPVLLSENFM